jgi:SAM-dependent methyltransferase
MAIEPRLDALISRALTGGVRPADVVELSRLFGEERRKRSGDYMTDPALLGAYLGFFLPHYAAKAALLLEQMQREGLVKVPGAPRVLDVGAGPLTGLFGAWLLTGALGPSVALDLAGRSMHAGKALLDELAPGLPVRLVEASVYKRPLPEGPFDLVIIAHVLNELGDPRRDLQGRTDLVRALLLTLAPGGRILIVEPGTRVHGRSLMALRDALVLDGVPILSPCRGAPVCPLLATPGDWCHGDLAWARPRAFIELEHKANLRKDVLKQSHLLLAALGDARAPTTGLRLVGGLMRDKLEVERRYGCGRAGLVVLRGQPKLAADINKPLRHGLVVREPKTDEVERERAPRATPSRGRSAPRGPRASAPRAPRDRGTGDRRRR